MSTDFAGNAPYNYTKRYQIMYIDRNPDSEVFDRIAALRMCTYTRHFVKDNLNHDVFIMYF